MMNPFFGAPQQAAPGVALTRAGLAPPTLTPQSGGMGPGPSFGGAATTSLDLPSTLADLIGQGQPAINQQAMGNIPMGTTATNQGAPVLDFRLQPTYADGGMVGRRGMPTYADGGMVGPNGMPDMGGGMGSMGGMPSGAPRGVGVQQMGAPQRMTPELMEMNIQEFVRTNPQEIAEFKQVVQHLISIGEVTAEELNMIEQLATTALQNPEMYPQIRQFAIQQGIATEQDISPEYDEGLIYVLILVARALKSNNPKPQAAPQNFADGGMVTPNADGSNGGPVYGAGTGTSDSVPIRVSTGEYVIPAHVVKMKGKEFFDTMLEKYVEAK